jgi:ATP-dependent RNA helicase DeaD
VPTDTESYVHRIGRTGRAGRSGEAILFVTPRERHMLRIIERATRQSIAAMELPSAAAVNEQRLSRLKERIDEILGNAALAPALAPFRELIGQYQSSGSAAPLEIAAALAYMAQGETPLMSEAPETRPRQTNRGGERENWHPNPTAQTPSERPRRPRAGPEAGMQTYRIEVGHQHGVKPANIVGAIANEAQMDSQHIGRIEIFDTHSLVDLPEGMPKETHRDLQKVWVAGQQLRLSRIEAHPGSSSGQRPDKPQKQTHRKGASQTKSRTGAGST